jgi:hypothetical protein
MRIIYTILLIFILPISVFAQNASLKGRVVDAVNNEPLPFVNVIVSGTSIGTITDMDGNFVLTGLTPGFVRVETSFVGYRRAVSSEVEVSAARVNSVEIQMEEQKEQIEEVTVTASPFRKTEESPVSLRSIGIG